MGNKDTLTVFFDRARLNVSDDQRLALPGLIGGGFVNLAMITYGILNPNYFWDNLIVGLGGLAYSVVVFYIIIPNLIRSNWLQWFIVMVNAVAVIGMDMRGSAILPGASFGFSILILYLLALLSGRRVSYAFLVIYLSVSIFLIPDSKPILQVPQNFSHAALLLIGITAVETIIGLKRTILTQLRRLQVVNNVARSVASSVELDEVKQLVSSAIQNALDADTYYLGLLEGDRVNLVLFYDDGEFFHEVQLPLEGTLAGQVMRTNRSILIRDIQHEMRSAPRPPYMVGKPRMSQSWMGTPLHVGKRIIGMVAVASYQRAAFNQDDLELLKNIAHQVAMAIDNAHHHTEVERQSRLDSLTGALNHGAFIKELDSAIIQAQTSGHPLSVMMLDIDNFKKYNDTYGHLVGDQVLSSLTNLIQQHIRGDDRVGRWGGEEFSILLTQVGLDKAVLVAERIQKAMQHLRLKDRNQQPIPWPTVSIGISEFPGEAKETYLLIDLADQRLYFAKERGRNQIEAGLPEE